MNPKLQNSIFAGIVLCIVILLFTILDHAVHGLEGVWSVPDYYFRNKIPYGFLWALLGLLFASKFQNVWLKAFTISGITILALQVRYFIEGYSLDFVFLFLLFHFIILYFLSVGMVLLLNKYNKS